jgi:glycosyltransferase involved in cell wall biosynthesis
MINKVSIVIPTFNRAQYLEKCIISCINQTQNCEIIVCDHGSNDETPQMIKKFGDRVKYIRREIDSGVHFCWLDGILHASEELIHINFDDDWIEPTFIEKCAKLFKEDVGCVISDAAIFHEDSREITPRIFGIEGKTGVYSSKIIESYNLKSLTSPCAGIYRKQILINNLFIGKLPFTKDSYHGVGPDILFSLMSALEYSKFGYVAEDLAIFRSHKNSITIDAANNILKSKQINAAYNSARDFYYIQKCFLKFNPFIARLLKYIIKYYAK